MVHKAYLILGLEVIAIFLIFVIGSTSSLDAQSNITYKNNTNIKKLNQSTPIPEEKDTTNRSINQSTFANNYTSNYGVNTTEKQIPLQQQLPQHKQPVQFYPNITASNNNKTYVYDFALSFSKEARPVAEKLYNLLNNKSRVFYDFANGTEPKLLGTDLNNVLRNVYGPWSKYVIVIVRKLFQK